MPDLARLKGTSRSYTDQDVIDRYGVDNVRQMQKTLAGTHFSSYGEDGNNEKDQTQVISFLRGCIDREYKKLDPETKSLIRAQNRKAQKAIRISSGAPRSNRKIRDGQLRADQIREKSREEAKAARRAYDRTVVGRLENLARDFAPLLLEFMQLQEHDNGELTWDRDLDAARMHIAFGTGELSGPHVIIQNRTQRLNMPLCKLMEMRDSDECNIAVDENLQERLHETIE